MDSLESSYQDCSEEGGYLVGIDARLHQSNYDELTRLIPLRDAFTFRQLDSPKNCNSVPVPESSVPGENCWKGYRD